MLRARSAPFLVFTAVFLLLLGLYWPARDAGWVSDTLGWLDAVRHQSFADFIHRRGFGVRSFYQTTQLATWSFYQLAGANRIAWHLLHIGLQALNAALLFTLFRSLLGQASVRNAAPVSLMAVLIFSLSPSLSEVIVWEAAFHYLQGLALILLQLLLLQRYLHREHPGLAVLSGFVFAIATFSLELFYLSPVFSLLLLAFYRFGRPALDGARIRRASARFLLPQLALLALHLMLVRLSFDTSTGRLGDGLWQHPVTYFAIKPPDYVLHLFGGRFLPQVVRSAWHQFFCTYIGAGLFYAALAATLSFIFFRFRRMQPDAQVLSWAVLMTLAAMALVTPMWFPERLLVMGDRYLYPMLPAFSLIPALVVERIRVPVIRWGVLLIVLCALAGGTRMLAGYWGQSEQITQQMQSRLPELPAGTRVILLNNPANYCGIPMTGAGADGEFALMRRLLYGSYRPAAIQETFAAEFRPGPVLTEVQQLAPLRFRVSLPDTSRRWWYATDYASASHGSGFRVRLISPQAYELELDPAADTLALAVWSGSRFRVYRLRPGAGRVN
jgi:hypothetical protein